MIDKVTSNARKPKNNIYGNKMLERMNIHHKALTTWALEHISLDTADTILDVGCGGGQTIYTMSKIAKDAKIYGIDYSSASIKKSASVNEDDIKNGKVLLSVENVAEMTLPKNNFDFATAFETVYYWQNIVKCFKNVQTVLKPGGHFLICNEDSKTDGNEEIIEVLNMNMYSAEEIVGFLTLSGFEKIKKYTHNNNRWICVVARRPI